MQNLARDHRVQFSLTPEQSLLKDTVERFARDRYGDNQRRAYRAEARGYSLDNWVTLADMGILSLPFAADDGGMGGGPRELMVVLEALGRVFAVEPMLEEVVTAGGSLAALGTAAQKSQWLPRIMSGSAHVGLAHFEHAARFNLTHVNLKAQIRDSVVTLNGQKMMAPLAAGCDQWIVSAREGGAPHDPSGIGFYFVSPTAPGIERVDFRLADGSSASKIRFQGVIAGERLPGGYTRFAEVMDTARFAAGAEMVGVMSTLFESTLEYLRCRQQFGVPLSSFQALQHRLADLYVLLEQSRSQLYRAAVCMESSLQRERSIAGMKSYLSAAAVKIGEECVHLHGGIGTTDELALGHGYKRLLVLATLLGDADTELTRFCKLAG
jgi:alkylation response protein AidB-like acyl-CoA dehydrogenase